jgi:hypothetical protein
MQGAPITKPDGPWARRDQIVCAAAAAVGMVLANYVGDRPFVLGPPLLLLAVRFFELARFRLVHLSGWLLAYTAGAVIYHVATTPWSEPTRLELALPLATAVLGFALHIQQRDHLRATVAAGLQRPNQNGEEWALGGALAAPFAGLVFAVLNQFAVQGIWLAALTMLALPVLWLQLVRSAWFPGCMIVWLLGVGIDRTVQSLANGRALPLVAGEATAIALAIVYLLTSRRVQRTFAGTATA